MFSCTILMFFLRVLISTNWLNFQVENLIFGEFLLKLWFFWCMSLFMAALSYTEHLVTLVQGHACCSINKGSKFFSFCGSSTASKIVRFIRLIVLIYILPHNLFLMDPDYHLIYFLIILFSKFLFLYQCKHAGNS